MFWKIQKIHKNTQNTQIKFNSEKQTTQNTAKTMAQSPFTKFVKAN